MLYEHSMYPYESTNNLGSKLNAMQVATIMKPLLKSTLTVQNPKALLQKFSFVSKAPNK